ncbi:MAG: hypothetical protein GY953_25970, partial [bacterium]|nr:hypothetical protein [bacterium]
MEIEIQPAERAFARMARIEQGTGVRDGELRLVVPAAHYQTRLFVPDLEPWEAALMMQRPIKAINLLVLDLQARGCVEILS